MKSRWTEVAEHIFETAKHMAERGLVIGASGNISARVPDTEILGITPSGIPYNKMKVEDIVFIDLECKIIDGEQLPSSEAPLHTLIMREKPNINAIVHTHSPYATAFSVLREPIPLVCNEGFCTGAAKVDVADYHLPGTLDLGIAALEALARQSGAKAVLLANHGLLTLDNSLDQAFSIAVNVEFEAKIYYIARSIGTPTILNKNQLDQVIKHYSALRKK